MIIELNIAPDTNELDIQELISDLTRRVLFRVDEEIEKKNKTLLKSKLIMKKLKGKISSRKEILQKESSELTREKALSRVLSLIETLNKEKQLIGQNKTKIINLLPKLSEYDFVALRNLEEKLYNYLPEKFQNNSKI